MGTDTRGKIFIGHGGSKVWLELKIFLQDRLHLICTEFNGEPVAGLSTKERLVQMLDEACFAFLVLTAEDEHGDGSKHPRGNVIHETGLFQGRLGFEKAIVLLEEGCEEFSNIHGLTQIRFPPGKIDSQYEAIRHVLERERIPGDGEQLPAGNRITGKSSVGSTKTSVEFSSLEIRYLLTASRRRNEQGLLMGSFDRFASRETASYHAMLEKFVDCGLMRRAGGMCLMTDDGYKFADRFWKIFVLNAVKRCARTDLDAVGTETIAQEVLLIDGESEARDVRRYISELDEQGCLKAICASEGIVGARITDAGHAFLRPFATLDFTGPE